MLLTCLISRMKKLITEWWSIESTLQQIKLWSISRIALISPFRAHPVLSKMLNNPLARYVKYCFFLFAFFFPLQICHRNIEDQSTTSLFVQISYRVYLFMILICKCIYRSSFKAMNKYYSRTLSPMNFRLPAIFRAPIKSPFRQVLLIFHWLYICVCIYIYRQRVSYFFA